MDERFARVLRQQVVDGFSDVRGAAASITLPVSERLLNDIVAESLPRSASLRDLHVTPQSGDRFSIRARLGASALVPPVRLTIAIDRQPDLPDSPVLILRMETAGLMVLAGPVLRLMNALPPGITVENGRIFVDLRVLTERYHLSTYLNYLEEIRVNTVEGAAVLTIRARIR